MQPILNRDSIPTELQTWNGGQATRAAWFNLRIKAAQKDFGFVQLNESATVAGSDLKGFVAVFSPAHGLEHAHGQNKGSFRSPNMRMREDLGTVVSGDGPGHT